MNVRGKVTAKIRERCMKLREQGKSHRDIETTLATEGIELSHRTVGAILKTEAERAKSNTGKRKGRNAKQEALAQGESGAGTVQGATEAGGQGGAPEGAKVDPTVVASRAETIAQLQTLLKEPMPELPEDANVAAVTAWQDLRAMRTVAHGQLPGVVAGDYPATQFAALMTSIRNTRKELRAALPPPKPDPAKDPTNIAAREMVHQQVLATIPAVEARSGRLCPQCRKAVA